MSRFALVFSLVLAAAAAAPAQAQDDPLPSWHDGASKQAIVDFVETVTDEADAAFVPQAERIAVFDNDGTLWVEQPVYTQLSFAFQRIKDMAPAHPDWAETQPFKGVLEEDLASALAEGEAALVKLIMASHAGMSTDAFDALVVDWLATAEHPRFARPYTELVYQPMLELLAYLRAHEFRTYIVSGGGRAFMRPWTEAVYGIPTEQVIGSMIELSYAVEDGEPVIMREAEIAFIDDKEGKPVGIYRALGKRPVFAFGNSDGDLQMLQWVTAGDGPRFAGIVHHDDAEREYAYDRGSHIGGLDEALDMAEAEGWTVTSIADDWAQVFAWEQ